MMREMKDNDVLTDFSSRLCKITLTSSICDLWTRCTSWKTAEERFTVNSIMFSAMKRLMYIWITLTLTLMILLWKLFSTTRTSPTSAGESVPSCLKKSEKEIRIAASRINHSYQSLWNLSNGSVCSSNVGETQPIYPNQQFVCSGKWHHYNIIQYNIYMIVLSSYTCQDDLSPATDFWTRNQ